MTLEMFHHFSVEIQYPSLTANANLSTLFCFFLSINIIKLHVYCHQSYSNSLQWAIWFFYWRSLSTEPQRVMGMKPVKREEKVFEDSFFLSMVVHGGYSSSSCAQENGKQDINFPNTFIFVPVILSCISLYLDYFYFIRVLLVLHRCSFATCKTQQFLGSNLNRKKLNLNITSCQIWLDCHNVSDEELVLGVEVPALPFSCSLVLATCVVHLWFLFGNLFKSLGYFLKGIFVKTR